MDCSNQPGATTTMQIARLDENPLTAANPSMVKIARHGAWGGGAGTVSNYILSFKSPLDWDGDSMLTTCKDLDSARFILTPLIRPPLNWGRRCFLGICERALPTTRPSTPGRTVWLNRSRSRLVTLAPLQTATR